MPLQRGVVILPLVSEHPPECLDGGCVADQPIPIIMADLVPEVAEQGPVGLVHALAPPLTFRVVGFGDADGDLAEVMSGHHFLAPEWIFEEIEHQSLAGIFGSRDQGKPQRHKRVDEPMFREFHQPPQIPVARLRQVGNQVIVPARAAELLPLARRDQPVAYVVPGILAKPEQAVGIAGDLPCQAVRAAGPVEGVKPPILGHVAEAVPAAFASGVLEIERLATELALEQLHGGPSQNNDWSLQDSGQPSVLAERRTRPFDPCPAGWIRWRPKRVQDRNGRPPPSSR